jgi:hypothetical protein
VRSGGGVWCVVVVILSDQDVYHHEVPPRKPVGVLDFDILKILCP